MTLFTLVGKIVIEASEAQEAIDTTIESAEELKNTMSGVKTQADNTAKSLGSSSKIGAAAVWLGNQLTSLTRHALNFSKQLIKTGFDFNTNMETYAASFKTLLGVDTAEAEAFVEKLRKFAVDTPFAMEGVVKAAVNLLSYGTSEGELFNVLNMLGDIAQGDQNKFDSIIKAYGQIMAYGDLRAQETYQLIDAGIPIYKLLADVMGMSEDAVRLLSSDPKERIDAIYVHEAFKKATEESGQYYQAMANYMDTYAGQLEKLGDASDQALGAFFAPFHEVMKENIFPVLSDSLEDFTNWCFENEDAIRSFAQTIGDVAVAAFNALTEGIKWLVSHSDEVVGAITNILQVFGILPSPEVDELAGFKEAYLQLMKDIQNYLLVPEVDLDGKIVALNRITSHREQLAIHAQASDTDQLSEMLGQDIVTFFEKLDEDLNVIYKAVPDENMRNTIASDFEAGVSGLNLKVAYTLVPTWANVSTNSTTDENGGFLSGMVNVGKKLFGVDGSNATGLNYVPFNGYISELHEGEAVLTKSEAEAWRQGKSSGIDYEQLADVMSQRPIAINIDGKAFATIMAKEMSRSIGNRNIQTLMGMGG